jgi:hypothetical protein
VPTSGWTPALGGASFGRDFAHTENAVPRKPRRVVILYAHPLLGEGIARLLRSDPGLTIEAVHVEDLETAATALGDSPDVIVMERGAIQAVDVLALAPAALLIDVGLDAGSSWAYHRDELSPQPEDILDAIRRCSARSHRAVPLHRSRAPHGTAPVSS